MTEPDIGVRSENIVDAVLKDLEDRSGFDWWWDGIDEDVQAEIRSALVEIVRQELAR